MTTIDGYPIDCVTDERLTYESEVTEFPIENGAPVADHIIAKRPVLELEGVVSDTPIGAIANDITRTSLSGSTLPSRDAFDRFVQLHDDRRKITVECSFGKFDDMVLTLLTPTRDKTTLKAFKFTATFRQIEIRQNNRTTIRVAVPGASGLRNFGALLGQLKDMGVTFVTSRPADPQLRALKIRAGDRLISTTTHKQRLATSLKKGGINSSGLQTTETGDVVKSNGWDLWEKAGFGPEGKMDHYGLEPFETETSDGYVTGHNKQDYYPYTSHITSTSIQGRRVHWDYRSSSWVDDESNVIVKKPPKGEDRWKGVTVARAPGPKP